MHIFITGGTRGIGFGLTQEFTRLGHQVSFTGTSLESVNNALERLSGNAFGLVCDVRDFDSIVNAKDKAIQQYNNIDIWINNAGVDQSREDISKLDSKMIKRVIDINVTGMMYGTKIALEQMKRQEFGIVYNVEGLGSNNMKIPKTIVYGSSKRLLTYFSQAADKEMKEYKNIFVGTFSPGMVFTDLLFNDVDEESLNVMGILGNSVQEVTPYLVSKMLQKKKTIKWLTTRKIIWRFFKSLFKKRDMSEYLNKTKV